MKKIIYGTMIGALLAGCSLIPDYKRPETRKPDGWKNGAAVDGKEQQIAPDWWKSFDSAELNTFMDDALAQNNDIRAALDRIEQARATIEIAGAALLPNVSGTGGASVIRSKGGNAAAALSGVSSTTGLASTGTGTSASFAGTGSGSNKAIYERSLNGGLDISYEIDLFGANEATVESARAAYYGSIYQQQALALTTMGDVADGYFLVLNLRERVKIAQQNLANAQDVLRIVNARFNAGASSALEVAQQKTVLSSSQAALSTLIAQESNAENALAVLLGKAPQDIQINSDTLKDLDVPDLSPTQPASLLERRPDIRTAEAALVQANANIGIARAAFFPTLDIGGDLSLAATSFTSPVTKVVEGTSSLLVPIFSGGSLEGQLLLDKARKAELVENYRKTILTSYREVEDALTAVKASRDREAALKDAVNQAERSYDLSRQLYNSGAVDFQTLLNAQAALLQTEDSYAAVRLEMLEASVDLYMALGGGWVSPYEPIRGPIAVDGQKKAPNTPAARVSDVSVKKGTPVSQ